MGYYQAVFRGGAELKQHCRANAGKQRQMQHFCQIGGSHHQQKEKDK